MVLYMHTYMHKHHINIIDTYMHKHYINITTTHITTSVPEKA